MGERICVQGFTKEPAAVQIHDSFDTGDVTSAWVPALLSYSPLSGIALDLAMVFIMKLHHFRAV